MAPANTIATTEALLQDGSVVAYRDADPSHVRERRFRAILEARPLMFRVILEGGSWFAVNLTTGSLHAAGSVFECDDPPPTPLRVVFYKRMHRDIGPHGAAETVMEFFALGWQTTVGGRNRRLGLKVYPESLTYEVTEDI